LALTLIHGELLLKQGNSKPPISWQVVEAKRIAAAEGMGKVTNVVFMGMGEVSKKYLICYVLLCYVMLWYGMYFDSFLYDCDIYVYNVVSKAIGVFENLNHGGQFDSWTYVFPLLSHCTMWRL
jgi:hypothetical protein